MNLKEGLKQQSIVLEFSPQEQEVLHKELRTILQMGSERIECLRGISLVAQMKDEILQLKRVHNERLKDVRVE